MLFSWISCLRDSLLLSLKKIYTQNVKPEEKKNSLGTIVLAIILAGIIIGGLVEVLRHHDEPLDVPEGFRQQAGRR